VQITGNGVAVQHSIDLNWNPPSTSTDPVAGYNIYRSTNGGASFTKLNGSVEIMLDYTDNEVQSGTTYTYVVKSVNASGQESGPSNQISLPVP
jgi:fibronectin type 3 domain-containing protein